MGFGSLSIKGRALRYLARREHSRAELERKLSRAVQDQPLASPSHWPVHRPRSAPPWTNWLPRACRAKHVPRSRCWTATAAASARGGCGRPCNPRGWHPSWLPACCSRHTSPNWSGPAKSGGAALVGRPLTPQKGLTRCASWPGAGSSPTSSGAWLQVLTTNDARAVQAVPFLWASAVRFCCRAAC